MNVKLLTTSLLAMGCGLAITIVSCNGDKDGVADAPSQPTRGQGTTHVLTNNCNSTLGVDRCATGMASATYDQVTGKLSVTNSTDLQSGLKSTFGPVHDGQVVVDAQLPHAASDQFTVVAHNGEIEEGRIELTAAPNANSQSALKPIFNAGDGTYSIEVYNDGQQVATQASVQAGSTTTVAYSIFSRWWRWIIKIVNSLAEQQKGVHMEGTVQAGACVWIVGNSIENASTIILPNGVQVQGDEIHFVEDVDGSGRYPYHSVDRLDVLSNMGTFDVLSEQVGN